MSADSPSSAVQQRVAGGQAAVAVAVAVAERSGSHSGGDERNPIVGWGAGDVSIQRGVQVYAIGDELDGHPEVVKQRDDRPGMAVVQGPHGVDQMSADAGTGDHR